MILTIDTGRDSLDDVLRTVGAAFAVDLATAGRVAGTEAQASGRPGGTRGSARPRRGRAAETTDASEIRRWAADNGYEVSSRGALPRNIVEAYRQVSTG